MARTQIGRFLHSASFLHLGTPGGWGRSLLGGLTAPWALPTAGQQPPPPPRLRVSSIGKCPLGLTSLWLRTTHLDHVIKTRIISGKLSIET